MSHGLSNAMFDTGGIDSGVVPTKRGDEITEKRHATCSEAVQGCQESDEEPVDPKPVNDCSDAVIPGGSLTRRARDICEGQRGRTARHLYRRAVVRNPYPRFPQTYEGPEEPADSASCETVNEDVPASRKAAISTTRPS